MEYRHDFLESHLLEEQLVFPGVPRIPAGGLLSNRTDRFSPGQCLVP